MKSYISKRKYLDLFDGVDTSRSFLHFISEDKRKKFVQSLKGDKASLPCVKVSLKEYKILATQGFITESTLRHHINSPSKTLPIVVIFHNVVWVLDGHHLIVNSLIAKKTDLHVRAVFLKNYA